MGSEFFSEKINAKKMAQPCVSSDARAGAHVSPSVNTKKQALLSDYINPPALISHFCCHFYVVN